MKVIRRLSSAAIALVALGAMAGPAWGQGDVSVGHSGWKWGNPQPQGNTLRQVEFVPGTIYASGEFGTLLRSDNGQTWTGIPTGLDADITDMRAVDNDTVIVGAGCVMRRSDDRGENFRRVPFVAREQNCPSNLAAFHFPSDQMGYVVLADGSVSQTQNGGQSFGGKREIPGTQAAGGGGAVPTDVFFVNDTTGFATAGGSLFRTTDSASNWTQEATTGGSTLNSVYFPDPSTGYAVGDNSVVLKSTDGGDTWNPMPAPNVGKLTSVRCASANACLFSSEGGEQLLRTTDGGTTITPLDPSPQPIFAATFISPTAAIGVGGFGATVLLPDVGTSTPTPTITPVSTRLGTGDDPTTLSRVRATDANLVHAPGAKGRVGRSTDGGKTWSTLQVPSGTQDITDVSFSDGNTGFTIDTSDALRFTSNAGAQWTPIDTGDTPNVNALLALDANTAMLFTDRGIYRSTAASDTSGGGTTFESIDNSKIRRTAFTDYDRTNGSAVYAWGPTSLWVSANRGATWRTVKGPVKKPRYRTVDFISSRQGFALTTDGRVWTTRNGGSKWTELPATANNSARDMAWGDAKHGYLVIPEWAGAFDGGWVLATSDGGATWRPQLLGVAQLAPGGLEAPSGSNAFALGLGQGRGADLFRTDNGGDLGAASTITVKPSTKRVRKASAVRVTVTLSPSVSGVPVALFARSGKSTRWSLVRQGVTTAGKLVVDTRVRATTRYVAQWFGDADRNGDGSPVTTVTLKK